MENEIKLDNDFWKDAEKRHKRGKIMGGFLVVTAGVLFLCRELGMEIPFWVFTWKTLLIGIGLLILVKNNFKNGKGLIPIVIGVVFLITDFYPGHILKSLIWPILIIIFGLMIIFKPRRNNHMSRNRMYRKHYKKHMHWEKKYENCTDTYPEEAVNTDTIDFTTIMGRVKKNVLSKNFKGGEVVNILGGSEINLLQADFEGSVTLEITNILGGTSLIIPANWNIQSELTSVIMGSIEDNRSIQPSLSDENKKTLIIKGTVVMGGVEIKN